MHGFNAFSSNVSTINWKNFPTHVGIYKLETSTSILERQKPKEFKEIWKDVSLRLILKDKGRKKHCLPICWFKPVGLDIFENEGTSEQGCVEIEDWDFSVQFVTLHLS